MLLVLENHCFYSGTTRIFGEYRKLQNDREVLQKQKENPNPEDKWVVFENTHEALVTQEQWDIVQKNRQQRRRPTRMGDMGMFSGLLFCADCGHVLNLNRTTSWKPESDNYTCGAYKIINIPVPHITFVYVFWNKLFLLICGKSLALPESMKPNLCSRQWTTEWRLG